MALRANALQVILPIAVKGGPRDFVQMVQLKLAYGPAFGTLSFLFQCNLRSKGLGYLLAFWAQKLEEDLLCVNPVVSDPQGILKYPQKELSPEHQPQSCQTMTDSQC